MKKTKLKDSKIKLGNFEISCETADLGKIYYNHSSCDLLNRKHDYEIKIQNGIIQLSLQLYKNIREHYRLFAFTKFNTANKTLGMVFSLNLTTEVESSGIIYLTQKIKFSEQYTGDAGLAKSYRSQKQVLFVDYLRKMGYEITENNDVILGIFDPRKKTLVNTTPETFLNDFILLSILKGHFQGNRGYQLEILPTFSFIKQNPISDNELSVDLPDKVRTQKRRRNISLSLRYKILDRDNFRCCKCNRDANDGIKLHVDHILPYSLGGTTEISNLQTLCNECNLGKSNNYIG